MHFQGFFDPNYGSGVFEKVTQVSQIQKCCHGKFIFVTLFLMNLNPLIMAFIRACLKVENGENQNKTVAGYRTDSSRVSADTDTHADTPIFGRCRYRYPGIGRTLFESLEKRPNFEPTLQVDCLS